MKTISPPLEPERNDMNFGAIPNALYLSPLRSDMVFFMFTKSLYCDNFKSFLELKREVST